MNQKETVSVILPTYNRATLISRAIRSVLDQTWQDLELIIVDDGSTDNTRQTVEVFTDDRIRYVRLQQNGGAARARNKGISEANGRYIAFIDSDAVWKPDKTAKQMEVMLLCGESIAMVYSRVQALGAGGEKLSIWPPYDDEINYSGYLFDKLLVRNWIDASTMLIRTDCLNKIGGLMEGMRCLEDWELALRIAEKWEIVLVDEILAYTDMISENRVSNNNYGYLEARCYLLSKYKQKMMENGSLERIMKEILYIARDDGYTEEAKQMLSDVLDLKR